MSPQKPIRRQPKLKTSPKYIFVIGGVMSGVGKGITSASLGRILQSRGFEVTNVKIDPYINVDAGTMNPTEHGEVFVLDDGMECDQDMGNYERFLGTTLSSVNYMTTGSVYKSVIEKERNLEYEGKCVQVVPHIPNEVVDRIKKAQKNAEADIVIIEIGGTVGEYENLLFLEAARMMKLEQPNDILVFLVSYLPIPSKIGEMKTKPTQHASRSLNSAGLQADFIIARAEKPLDDIRKGKISLLCNVVKDHIISAPDIDSVYQVPIVFEEDNLSTKILKKFDLRPRKKDLKDWEEFVSRTQKSKKEINIAIIGKYFETGNFVLSDAYISVLESIKHAAYFHRATPKIDWFSSKEFEDDDKNVQLLKKYDGILIPGGFGSRGINGKLKVIQFAREQKIPYLGLCYGMQLAAIEFARNAAGLEGAHTTEVDPETAYPIIHIMPDQELNLEHKSLGGSMRLGAYDCETQPRTLARRLYGPNKDISERHRHRYEVNTEYIDILEKNGLVFSGINLAQKLVEIIELSPSFKHPFFIASQFHPEFKSHPLNPHPLFKGFIKAGLRK